MSIKRNSSIVNFKLQSIENVKIVRGRVRSLTICPDHKVYKGVVIR